MSFDVASFTNLSRPALQKMAKEHKIKANLKSEVIIHLLTQRYDEYTNASWVNACGIEPTVFQEDKREPTIPPGPPLREDGELLGFDEEPPTRTSSNLLQGNPKSQSPSVKSIYTLATPESSIAGTPEPEASLEIQRSTVEVIAGLAAIDQGTVNKLVNLRLVVGTLHRKATDMRDLLKAERAMRQRLEDFSAHWTNINSRWTYDEVWAGELRVRSMQATREVTTSDEDEFSVGGSVFSEGTTDRASGATLLTSQKSSSSQANRMAVRRQRGDTDSPSTITVGATQAKRQRLSDREGKFEPVYQPRPRSGEYYTGVRSTVTSPPAQAAIGKGKGRMPADEVEEMYLESQHTPVLPRYIDKD